jgi:hypothetical protein
MKSHQLKPILINEEQNLFTRSSCVHAIQEISLSFLIHFQEEIEKFRSLCNRFHFEYELEYIKDKEHTIILYVTFYASKDQIHFASNRFGKLNKNSVPYLSTINIRKRKELSILLYLFSFIVFTYFRPNINSENEVIYSQLIIVYYFLYSIPPTDIGTPSHIINTPEGTTRISQLIVTFCP